MVITSLCKVFLSSGYHWKIIISFIKANYRRCIFVQINVNWAENNRDHGLGEGGVFGKRVGWRGRAVQFRHSKWKWLTNFKQIKQL